MFFIVPLTVGEVTGGYLKQLEIFSLDRACKPSLCTSGTVLMVLNKQISIQLKDGSIVSIVLKLNGQLGQKASSLGVLR